MELHESLSIHAAIIDSLNSCRFLNRVLASMSSCMWSTAMTGKYCFAISIYLLIFKVFLPSSKMMPEPWSELCNTDNSFITYDSTDCPFLHVYCLWITVLVTFYSKIYLSNKGWEMH